MIKKSIIGILARIRKSSFEKELFEIKNVNGAEGLKLFQEKYLKKIIFHAYKNTPYHRSIFEKIGVIVDNQINLVKFNEIPILTKETIRDNFDKLISEDLSQRKWFYNSSGGSTGTPLRLIQDDSRNKWGSATSRYYYRDIIGIDEISAKKIILWGSERDIIEGSVGLKAKVKNWLENTVFLNSFKITENDMGRYIKIINIFKPDFIKGYTSSLYELCRYIEKNKIKMHRPKFVVSGAETLSDEKKVKIEKIFNAKLYDFYGSRETSCLAGQCKFGFMHILMFNNYVEILNKDNQPVEEGEEGRVVVTCLHNYAMPLIRYEIGDTAILGTEKCRCGNFLPTLKKITGRITDNFIKKDGTIVHGEYFTHLFYLKDWVKTFQVIQEDYEKIKILMVLNGEKNNNEKEDIENKIKLVMGIKCNIKWELVKNASEIGEKHLYTKSKIINK